MGVYKISTFDFEQISINDKALFDKYLKQYKPEASELTFTNLFMWRDFYKIRYSVLSDLLCVIAMPDGVEPYAFMPVGSLTDEKFDRTISLLKEYFKGNGWKLKFRRITRDETGYFKKYAASQEDIISDRNSSDYLYSCEDLTFLKGKKYDGKRNHINKFKKLYEFEYVPIANEFIDECKRIMDVWCSERDCEEHREFYCEKVANSELLDNIGILGCKGALIKVDGKFEAFTVGEMLNDDTAVIHIEKANSKINGLYTFINQQFCEHEWQNAKYINREQDLGVEGLRKAKLSYNPERLVEKYVINIG